MQFWNLFIEFVFKSDKIHIQININLINSFFLIVRVYILVSFCLFQFIKCLIIKQILKLLIKRKKLQIIFIIFLPLQNRRMDVQIQTMIELTNGQISIQQAQQYLKWARNNVDIAMNYYFAAEERKMRKSNTEQNKAMSELMEGAKKQQKLQKIIKDLKEEYNKPIEELLNVKILITRDQQQPQQTLNYFETKDLKEQDQQSLQEIQQMEKQESPEQPLKQKAERKKKVAQQQKSPIVVKAEQPCSQIITYQKIDHKFPLYIGQTQIQGYIVGSHNLRDIKGQQLELKYEKQQTQLGKKQEIQNLIRILYKDNEIGRVTKQFEQMLCPLMGQEFIHLLSYQEYCPDLCRTMDTIIIRIEVFMCQKLISDITKDTIDEESQKFLQYRINLQDLFNILDIKIIEDTLIQLNKRDIKPAQVKETYQQQTPQVEKDIVLYQNDPFKKKPQQTKLNVIKLPNDENSRIDSKQITINEQEEQEKEEEINYDQLISLQDQANDELDLFQPQGMVTQLYNYQKQALTWLLQREGVLNTKVDKNYRQLHPLWRQYQNKDGLNVYFNPFSGQVSLIFPNSSQKCKGGILADEMGLGKTVMFIALINSNPFDPNLVQDYVQQSSIKIKRSIADFIPNRPKKWAKTLIIVPLSLLSQWDQEIKTHSQEKKSVFLYYGNERNQFDLSQYDIVISTYGTVSHEYTKKEKEQSIFYYNWFRIILDEAHYIKGRTIQVSQAIYEIDGLYRWCSTGTPVQNKLDELFSLLHFIRLEPWSDYVWWNTHINKPYEQNDSNVFKLLQTIMKPILLRRTKQSRDKEGNKIIDLPEKNIFRQIIPLSEEERNIYDHVEKRSQQEIQTYMSKGILMAQYMKMFELLLRLRQICDHPYLITTRSDVKNITQLEESLDLFIHQRQNKSTQTGLAEDVLYTPDEQLKYKNEIIRQIKENEQIICPVCLDPIDDAVVSRCLHLLCRLCMSGVLSHNSLCPCCRQFLRKDDFMTLPRESQFSVDWKQDYKRSSKLERLFEILSEVPKQDKCVIFTQFIGMIELIEFDLQKQGQKFLRLDGKLNQNQRTEVLKIFKEDESYRFFIISLKAGGVGLNLTSANHVVLIDPWWNPAVEDQAIERIYRIGQKKDVFVHRLIIQNTVEERIIKMHQVKQQLFDESMSSENKHQKVEMLKNIIMNN
ncbi:hypothetical protein pb186bvf_009287 [Paramecium bursaria]